MFFIIIVNILKVCICTVTPGENLAFHKPVESSTLFRQRFVKTSRENVVDGSNSSERHTCMSTALGDPNPWIQVDLLRVYKINSVSLRNTLPSCDGCSSKLHDVHIEAYREKPSPGELGNGDECYFYKEALPLGKEENLQCKHPVTGRFVEVYSKDRHKFDTLALCELRVYGERIDAVVDKDVTFRLTRRSVCECAVVCSRHQKCARFKIKGPSCTAIMDSQQARKTTQTLSIFNFLYKKAKASWILI